jgi:hypothetical protein
LKEDLPDKESESARFQFRQMLNQQENPLRDKTVGVRFYQLYTKDVIYAHVWYSYRLS